MGSVVLGSFPGAVLKKLPQSWGLRVVLGLGRCGRVGASWALLTLGWEATVRGGPDANRLLSHVLGLRGGACQGISHLPLPGPAGGEELHSAPGMGVGALKEGPGAPEDRGP